MTVPAFLADMQTADGGNAVDTRRQIQESYADDVQFVEK
jgi:hypothetical protein